MAGSSPAMTGLFLEESPPPMPSPKKPQVKRVVLAYSGGLDTSIILKWLQTTYGCEVVTFTADLGQGEELEPARKKAELLGIKPENIFIEDLREEFVRDYVFPMFRANALYEGQYLLGTSIARPLIAKKQIEIAAQGRRRRGRAWRDRQGQRPGALRARPITRSSPTSRSSRRGANGSSRSRTTLIEFAEQHQIPIAKDKRGEAPFSVDANLLHSSSEGKVLEDPAQEAPDYVYSRTDRSRGRAGQADRHRDRFREGRRGRDRRQEAVAGDAADDAQRARPRQRHRPARPRREPLRRHEVARHVRDAGRHDPARRASRHRVDHARPRRRASQGRADAEIRRADLQRLLVLARARDAAGADRQEPGIRHRPRARSSSTRAASA